MWPLFKEKLGRKWIINHAPHKNPQTIEAITEKNFRHIAIAIDFSASDKKSISAALQIGGKNAKYTLLHTVETPGAFIYGTQIKDYETDKDREFLKNYKNQLETLGYSTDINLSFGNPKKAIPKLLNAEDVNFDLLVMGRHGHKMIKDILLGTTVDVVRHRVEIPIFIT